jgi:hypothetical protein
MVINQWVKQYNHIRPHHALGMRPSGPETIFEKPKSPENNNGARHAPPKLCISTLDLLSIVDIFIK